MPAGTRVGQGQQNEGQNQVFIWEFEIMGDLVHWYG